MQQNMNFDASGTGSRTMSHMSGLLTNRELTSSLELR